MGVTFDVFNCGMGQAETVEVDCREGIGRQAPKYGTEKGGV